MSHVINMIMTHKWLLIAMLMGGLMITVSSQPVQSIQTDPIQVYLTCMSVLNVMSDHVSHVQSVIWQSTSTNIKTWLWTHVPEHHLQHLHIWQHVLEVDWMSQLRKQPDLMPLALAQAHECQLSLLNKFSTGT